MNWDLAGVVAEIIGATAVVITLAYLSVQIRLTREASQVHASYTTVEIYGNWRNHLIENDKLAAIVAKANRGDPLSPEEDIQVATLMDDLFITTAMSHTSGIKSNALYDSSGEVNYIERIFRQNPGLVPYWARTRDYISTSFLTFAGIVDSHLADKTFPLLIEPEAKG